MEEDIIYGEPLDPRVIAVLAQDDYLLLLTFDNGEKRFFDVKPLLSYKVFAPLKNKDFYKSVKVAFGSILWPNDIDYCPDTLYANSTPFI